MRLSDLGEVKGFGDVWQAFWRKPCPDAFKETPVVSKGQRQSEWLKRISRTRAVLSDILRICAVNLTG